MKVLIEREGIEVEALVEAPREVIEAGRDTHRIYYLPDSDLYLHCERRSAYGDWFFALFDSDGVETLVTRSLMKVLTLLKTGELPVEVCPEGVPPAYVPVRA